MDDDLKELIETFRASVDSIGATYVTGNDGWSDEVPTISGLRALVEQLATILTMIASKP